MTVTRIHGPTLSETFHQETKYAPEDMEKFAFVPLKEAPPEPFKNYHTESAVDLIGYLPFDRHPFTGGELPDRDPEATAGGLYGISRLLYFTNGVTGIMPMRDGSRHYFRAAPSAGALYPTEIYLAVRDLPDLADGIYNYQVRDHTLAPVWEGQFWQRLSAATCAHGALEQANVAVLLTGCWARGTWRYGQRAYRRALLDTGHVLGNLNAMGPLCGYGVFPVGGFIDSAINNMLLVDDADEGALVLVALPRLDRLDLQQTGGALLPSAASHGVEPDPDDALLHQLHQAGNVTDPSVCITAPRHHPNDPDDRDMGYRDADNILALDHQPLDLAEEGGMERLILRRRSARRFDPAPITLSDLGSLLSFAYQPTLGLAESGIRQMFDPALLDTHLIINRSDETGPGIYYYAPQRHELRQIADADPIEAARHLCLDQELGADAGVLVIHTADLQQAIERYGDRAYRYLHLDAGHIGHRLNLAAEALGLKASGIGGFYDDDVIRLLKLPPRHLVAYITTLGTGVVDDDGDGDEADEADDE